MYFEVVRQTSFCFSAFFLARLNWFLDGLVAAGMIAQTLTIFKIWDHTTLTTEQVNLKVGGR